MAVTGAAGPVPRFRLDGKTALVTGAASGIGRAIAQAFAEQGARVCVADIDFAGASRAAHELSEEGHDVMAALLDVADTTSGERNLRSAAERLGRLDVLVNNAGIGLVGSVEETEAPDWDRLMAVNVGGVYRCSRVAVRLMLSQDPPGGSVINIASVAALVGLERRFAYSATKGAVVAMTRQMAVDYAKRGIRVNAICPGTIHTPFVDAYLNRSHSADREATIEKLHARQAIGRMGRPDEIADCAVYLASDNSSFATGSIVVIDGGLTAG